MQSRETRFVLRIESGERQGEQVPLQEGTLQVGRRADCGLVLADGSVSGKHAELRVSGDRIQLVDLGSTNGTRVGGHKIAAETELGHGDTLLFGNVKATLHDARLAGDGAAAAPVPAAAAAPAGDAGALGQVSAEKVTRSRSGSKLPLLLIVALLVVGGGAYAYLRFLRPGGTTRTVLAVPGVPGNLLADGSFEEGTSAWVAAESAPVGFQGERGFARSGEVGLGAVLEGEAWSLARSPEIVLQARRSLACAFALRLDEGAEGRVGVELASSGGAFPAFFAWQPARRASGAFEELSLAFDVPGGYDRARLVVLARGPGAVALDDVSALLQDPVGRGVTFAEYELAVLGEPGSCAVFQRSGRALLTGFDLSRLTPAGPAGWSGAELRASAGARGFTLAFPGVPRDAELVFTGLRPDDSSGAEPAWVATTGPSGYAAYGGDFTRTNVTSLLLGSGTELLRLGFERPVEVEATAVSGGMTFAIALDGQESCEMQLTFGEERAEASALADRAAEAERAQDLGRALAVWTELLDRFPFERKLVARAAEARARLVQSGLNQVDELRREMERARFFALPELFRTGEERAAALARQYHGSEVEAAAAEVVALCQRAYVELSAGARSGADRRLHGVLQALDAQEAPALVQHVRAALEQDAVSTPAQSGTSEDGGER